VQKRDVGFERHEEVDSGSHLAINSSHDTMFR
jgi:hypothetical protein